MEKASSQKEGVTFIAMAPAIILKVYRLASIVISIDCSFLSRKL